MIEIPFTLWSLGFQHYNPFGRVPHASLHLFDALIITTTFVLEFVLRGKERELAELLIVLRLWRLIKLIGGNT
jgi:voltage-gated hydrogen channel 1